MLDVEEARGELRYYNDGVTFKAGGSWNSYVWKADDNTRMLDIQCRLVEDAPWFIEVFVDEDAAPGIFLDWPTSDFRQQLRDALATIRS